MGIGSNFLQNKAHFMKGALRVTQDKDLEPRIKNLCYLS